MNGDLLPHRIVSLQPSGTVIIAAVGQLDRVVACTRYCKDVVPELANRRHLIVADSWTAHAAEILAANPDLVIAAVPYQDAAVSEILRAGIRFLGLAPRTLNDVYADIALISGMVGEPAQGQSVIAKMKSAIIDARAATAKLERPRVFCEEWGKPLISSQPWVAELVDAAGGVFVGEPGKQTSPSSLAAANPDLLIASWCGAGDRVPLKKIVRDRAWENLNAVRTDRVFCIRDEYLNTPAPTLLSGLQCLLAALHPEQFPAPRGLRQITEVSPVDIGKTPD